YRRSAARARLQQREDCRPAPASRRVNEENAMKTSTEKMIGRITFSERSGSTMRQQSERVPDSAEKTADHTQQIRCLGCGSRPLSCTTRKTRPSPQLHDVFPLRVMKSKSHPSSACKTLALKRCA